MLAVALEAEVDATLPSIWRIATILVTGSSCRNGPRDPHREDGRQRHRGHRPRVDDKRVRRESVRTARGSTARSCSVVPHSRRSAVLPLLYLHGLSTGDFVRPCRVLRRRSGLSGPSSPADENLAGRAAAFASRSLASRLRLHLGRRIHFNVRLGEDRLCCLVRGRRAGRRAKRARGHPPALRESDRVLASLLRDCKRRGMRAPVLAVGARRPGSGRRCADRLS